MTQHNMVDEFDAWFKHNHAHAQRLCESKNDSENKDAAIEFRLNCREGWMAAWDRLTQLNAASAPTPQECPHGVDDGACKQCYDEATSGEKGAALSDEQARTVECADSWLRMRGLQTYTDLRDTLFAVLRAIGYTEEFAEAHPDLKVSEGVKLFLAAHSAGAQGEPIPGSPAFSLRGLYKPVQEYFIDGKPATPAEYIDWQSRIIEAVTKAKLPDPKYYGTQDEDGNEHDVKCAYVDGWNQCRASILEVKPLAQMPLDDERNAFEAWAASKGHRFNDGDLNHCKSWALSAWLRRAEIAGAQPQPMTQTDAARDERKLRPDEEALFKATVDELLDCNETSTPYQTLLDWANRGLLECAHFEVTVAGNAEIERIERETKSK